jgi:16S rRNA (uracil1498-N3)-methyltransferase
MPHIPRVYLRNSIIVVGGVVHLSESQSIHVKTVLRIRKKDKVIVFNEIQGSFLGYVENIANLCSIFIEEFFKAAEKLKPLVVGVPLIKNRGFNIILEISTQLGCTKIVPINFDHSQFSIINLIKISKQLIGSVEQSGRCTAPVVTPMSLAEFIFQSNFILCANEKANSRIKEMSDLVKNQKEIAILVGPEGGFSAKEQDILFSSSNVFNVSLGDLILRSETAVSCMLSQIKVFY